jgi:hypothetical protein
MLIGFYASSKAGGSQWKEKPAAKIVFTTESADDRSSGENCGGYHRRIIRRASGEKSFARCLWLRGTPASSEGELVQFGAFIVFGSNLLLVGLTYPLFLSRRFLWYHLFYPFKWYHILVLQLVSFICYSVGPLLINFNYLFEPS